jgi:hypothetical protein
MGVYEIIYGVIGFISYFPVEGALEVSKSMKRCANLIRFFFLLLFF